MAPQHICRDATSYLPGCYSTRFPIERGDSLSWPPQGEHQLNRGGVLCRPAEQLELLAAVNAHTFVSSGPRRAALERRIEDTVRLLEWLSPTLETERVPCPATQTRPQLSAPIGGHRVLTRMRDPTPSLLSEQDWAPCYEPFGRNTGDFSEADQIFALNPLAKLPIGDGSAA